MSRVDLNRTTPTAYTQLSALTAAAVTAAHDAGLDTKLIELVKIRVSQINGCAYCLRAHAHDAIAAGESSERLAVIAAWWESQYFSEQEQAALALAEEVTRLSVPERVIDTSSLNDEQIAAISWVAIALNSWNRVAIRSGYPVGP